MSKARLTSKDKGFAKLKKLAEQLGGRPHVKVGVLASSGADQVHDGGLTNVELAVVLHYGTDDGHVPARPFLTQTAHEQEKKWERLIAEVGGKIIEGKLSLERGLGLIGQRASADVKNTITKGEGVPPPNAPSTIARKGSSRPLVDSGRVVQSISYDVVIGAD